MKLLLDTHVALWWFNDPAKLTQATVDAVADPRNEVFLSSIGVWEVEIKVSMGRLPQTPIPLDEASVAAGFIELPISWRHARVAGSLPPLHRDPFDRMLIAQALQEGMVLATRDPLIEQYDVPTLTS